MFFIDPPILEAMGFARLCTYLPVQNIPVTARPRTLVALALVLTALYLLTSTIANSLVAMARKRKSGASRVTVAMSPKDEIDSRPESS